MRLSSVGAAHVVLRLAAHFFVDVVVERKKIDARLNPDTFDVSVDGKASV